MSSTGEGDGRSAHIDKAKTVELYATGASISDIHRALGYSHNTIRKVLLGAGVEIRSGQQAPSHVDHAAIVTAYQAGQTQTQIRETLGYAMGTIRATLVAAGVEIRPTAGVPKPPRPTRAANIAQFEADVIADYTDLGMLIGDIETKRGRSRVWIRRVLDKHGIPRIDERSLNSGGKPRVYDDATVAEVARLYQDEGLSRREVATRAGLPYKTVVTIMSHLGIQARPAASTPGLYPGVDRATGLKQQIADLGVTPREIKAWALREGLILSIAVGLPPARLVTAYADAHPDLEAS